MSNMRDFSPVMKALGLVIREHVAKAFGALSERMAAIEQRFTELPVPKDGTSVTLDDVRPVVADAVKEAVEALPKAEDGTSVTADDVLPAILLEVGAKVDEALAAIPKPKDGASITLEDVQPILDEAIKAFPVPENGKDGTSVKIEEVLPQLQDQVKAAIEALPVPHDGKSVTVEQVMEALTPALNSMHSAWALDFERRATDTLQRACERIPKPKDGDNGLDGLGFDDMSVEHDGERLFTLKFQRGDVVKAFPFRLPVVLDRNVYKEGHVYEKGDAVTFAGSLWIAQADAVSGKPGLSTDWRLAVKRGRDGKDGVVRTVTKPETVKL